MAVSRTKLERICAKNPTSILFARLADEFLRQGNTKRALETCRRGLRYRPSYVTGHVVMGRCHLAAGRFEEARQEFQKVLQLDSDNLTAFWHLGQIDLEMGWEEMALRNFERAYALDPFNRDLAARIEALQNAGSGSEAPQVAPASGGGGVIAAGPIPQPDGPAVEAPDAALEAEPEGATEAEGAEGWPAADRGLSTLVRELDGNPEGVPFLNHRADWTEAIATPTLAEIYVSQGLIQQAVDVLKRVLERDPDDKRVRQRLDELKNIASGPREVAR